MLLERFGRIGGRRRRYGITGGQRREFLKTPMYVDGHYFIGERQRCEARGISNMVDPLVACDCRNPRSEGLRRRVCVPFGMNGEKCVLPRILRNGAGKPPPVIAAQPG